MQLQGRSLLTLFDYTPGEIRYLLDLARRVKQEAGEGRRLQRFQGLTLAMIFEKNSTRTRCAFETAFGEEGGHPVFLSLRDIQLGAKETVEDTARVLGRMFDALEFRGFEQKTAETLSRESGIPVYNGLTDLYHPTQVLADLMTLEEAAGSLEGRTLCYMGDGRNNVARSLLIGCALMGVHCRIIAPADLQPDSDLVSRVRGLAEQSGSQVEITPSRERLAGADAVYTDVWASMGEEDKAEERRQILGPYQVDQEAMAQTDNRKAVFLHCLPAVRGNEVVPEVIDGELSRVFDQAENRKHTIKAVMLATLGRDKG